MKTLAKVFIIIAMIGACWTIIVPIFGFLALKKLKTATCRADILPKWGILTLLFCSTPGGIVMLCMQDEHFRN